MSKDAEEEKSARAVTHGQTDRQTDKLYEKFCSVQSIFNPRSIAKQNNT
jgi:hypothetical protein